MNPLLLTSEGNGYVASFLVDKFESGDLVMMVMPAPLTVDPDTLTYPDLGEIAEPGCATAGPATVATPATLTTEGGNRYTSFAVLGWRMTNGTAGTVNNHGFVIVDTVAEKLVWVSPATGLLPIPAGNFVDTAFDVFVDGLTTPPSSPSP